MNALLAADDFEHVAIVPRSTRVPEVRIVIEKVERSPALIYAENRLKPWADWIRNHRMGLGFASISLLFKAMRRKAVHLKHKREEGPELTARGSETRVMTAPIVGDPPEAVSEVEAAVNALAPELRDAIIAFMFVYGPREARAKAIGIKLALFDQRVKTAKYSIHAALTIRATSYEETAL